MIIPSAGFNISFEFFIKFFFSDQVFQRQMHSVFPIILWVCRNINPLIMWIFATNGFAHAQEILKLENAPHGGGIKMLNNNCFIDPWFAKPWRITPLAQLMIKE